jgi:hypothetical protein
MPKINVQGKRRRRTTAAPPAPVDFNARKLCAEIPDAYVLKSHQAAVAAVKKAWFPPPNPAQDEVKRTLNRQNRAPANVGTLWTPIEAERAVDLLYSPALIRDIAALHERRHTAVIAKFVEWGILAEAAGGLFDREGRACYPEPDAANELGAAPGAARHLDICSP